MGRKKQLKTAFGYQDELKYIWEIPNTLSTFGFYL